MTDVQQMMVNNTIVKHYAGSISYGTNIATSDVDYRGVFSADPVNIRTPFFPVKECSDLTEEDTKLYELTHFVRMCIDCNPNIIETLWVDESDIVITSPAYQLLRDNRERLLSKKIAHTTSGYAFSQLQRIKGHNKWLTQADRGINKLKQAFNAGEIDIKWLSDHFDDDIINKVTTRG